ncbi:MAG: putative Ig domain-containing protein, partial [Terracidiphilus sp.]
SSGQQNQFIALATDSSGLQYDVTGDVVWKSETPSVATICTQGSPTPCTAATDGVATAGNAGSTLITATLTQGKSELVAPANYTLTIGTSPEPLISINVVPGSVTVSNEGMTQQYLAFGTFTTIPTVRDITDSVTWVTLDPDIASINTNGASGEPAGLATAQGEEGLGVIYAENTTFNPDGTLVLSNPVTFTCDVQGSNPPVCNDFPAQSLLTTVTAFNAGSNDTNWLITAPTGSQIAAGTNICTPATGCQIHCGPGSETAGYGNSVCTGTYAAGTAVMLTASLAGNSTSTEFTSTFGGWTANCDTSTDVPDLASTCTLPAFTDENFGTSTIPVVVPVSGNQSVGALFYGLTLSCSSVTPSGTVGVPFISGALTATGGTGGYTFSVVGTLPAGLTLNAATGQVTGTPTATGSFSITATDAGDVNAESPCAITINPAS